MWPSAAGCLSGLIDQPIHSEITCARGLIRPTRVNVVVFAACTALELAIATEPAERYPPHALHRWLRLQRLEELGLNHHVFDSSRCGLNAEGVLF
jgi:hypothetical protein